MLLLLRRQACRGREPVAGGGDDHSLTIMGLITMTRHGDKPEVTVAVDPDKMCGVVAEQYWFGVDDGKPVFLSRFSPLPNVNDDEQILPFWSGGSSYKFTDFHREPLSPHFDIQHLCGYNYTPEKALKEAARLESYGFFCMRSKRGNDGRYWEVWRLNGYWAAKGELEVLVESDAFRNMSENDKMNTVSQWLCRNCSFGTLDVSCQRAAMVIDGD